MNCYNIVAPVVVKQQVRKTLEKGMWIQISIGVFSLFYFQYTLSYPHVRLAWFIINKNSEAVITGWMSYFKKITKIKMKKNTSVILSYAYTSTYTHAYTCRMNHNDTMIKDERRLH